MTGSRGASVRHAGGSRIASAHRRSTGVAAFTAGTLGILVVLLELALYRAWIAALSVATF